MTDELKTRPAWLDGLLAQVTNKRGRMSFSAWMSATGLVLTGAAVLLSAIFGI